MFPHIIATVKLNKDTLLESNREGLHVSPPAQGGQEGKLNFETEKALGKAGLVVETGSGFSPSFSKHLEAGTEVGWTQHAGKQAWR